jgi:hypothetical protein
MPAAKARLGESASAGPARRRYTAYVDKDPRIAMLKQFAPIAVMPPSPKMIA